MASARNKIICYKQAQSYLNILATESYYKDYKPLATINPPSTKTSSNVNEPRTLVKTCVLPSAAIKRKRDKAI